MYCPFGELIESTSHNKGSYKYNKLWEDFFKNPKEHSREEILTDASKYMDEIYGK